jgi:hypothetical protein
MSRLRGPLRIPTRAIHAMTAFLPSLGIAVVVQDAMRCLDGQLHRRNCRLLAPGEYIIVDIPRLDPKAVVCFSTIIYRLLLPQVIHPIFVLELQTYQDLSCILRSTVYTPVSLQATPQKGKTPALDISTTRGLAHTITGHLYPFERAGFSLSLLL